MVYVKNAKDDHVTCRLLLDTGSELSYVSERCIQALGLTRSASPILVTGISSVKADTTRGCSTLQIKSRISDDRLVVYAHVLGRITSSLERQNIDASTLEEFKDMQLAHTHIYYLFIYLFIYFISPTEFLYWLLEHFNNLSYVLKFTK